MDESSIKYLFERYFSGECTTDERVQLMKLFDKGGNEQLLKSLLEQKFTEYPDELSMNNGTANEILEVIFSAGKQPVYEDKLISKPASRIHFIKTAFFRYAAAAILILGIATYLWVTNKGSGPVLTNRNQSLRADIPAGNNGAILTLADGRKIVLDSLGNGFVAMQNGTEVSLNEGTLAYSASDTGTASFNTMSTPKGRQFTIQLPDRTRVWLNAASSITYPTVFRGKSREVSIIGEAYFEVAKNKTKPFIVTTPKDRIAVIGTAFNVNAYPDEPFAKTSLVEGAVKINDRILKPGQAFENGKIFNTNMDQDIAWKNGYFNFNDVSLPAVMRQLERWYDIEVKYAGDVSGIRFKGKMDRGVNLSDVLFFFTEMNIKYQLEGRTLTVYN